MLVSELLTHLGQRQRMKKDKLRFWGREKRKHERCELCRSYKRTSLSSMWLERQLANAQSRHDIFLTAPETTTRLSVWGSKDNIMFLLAGLLNVFMVVLAMNAEQKVFMSWPAISNIWLGVRTVPVLSVAKEVAAPARSPTGRGAPEHRQVDAEWLIDDRVSRNFWVLSVCWCFLLF